MLSLTAKYQTSPVDPTPFAWPRVSRPPRHPSSQSIPRECAVPRVCFPSRTERDKSYTRKDAAVSSVSGDVVGAAAPVGGVDGILQAGRPFFGRDAAYWMFHGAAGLQSAKIRLFRAAPPPTWCSAIFKSIKRLFSSLLSRFFSLASRLACSLTHASALSSALFFST